MMVKRRKVLPPPNVTGALHIGHALTAAIQCITMNKECASEQSHGLMTGPSNNIHKELKFDYVDNFDRHNSGFTNSVSPLQYHTTEKYQVSHSDMFGGYDDKPLLMSSNAKHLGNLRGGNKIQETSSIDALNSYPGLMSSGPCCLTIQLMDVGNAKTDVVAVSVDHNFSTYLHNGFLSVVPGKKDSGIMLQRNKCQFSGIDESSAISAVMEGVHVVNGLEYKMYCSSSKFDGFQKNSIQMVKPAKGTTTLAFIFKEGVMVAADSRASMGGYIFDGESGKKRRWSEGIHLVVEAKEGLPIQADSVVVAQITYQSMFKLYPKLSGMTGTAKTEHPTFIAFYHTSILFKKDIFHKALYFENYTTYGYSSKYVGKNENKSWTYEKAKSIISESIEMSQSMGLDELQRLVEEQAEMYPLGPCIAIAYLSVLKDCEIHCFHEGLEVKRLGGLHVIGTSLHESRRIDNQSRKARRSWINTLHGQVSSVK
ncbi:unnamed protein product [Lactuca saligna]|uniref:chloroplast protein-transporting ATPase n=1 Tax=Lactuca saligna TaxID=75948 RepID=A0AA35YZ75_LACSI|nr:unnamed protein product [Lactuca saligna]